MTKPKLIFMGTPSFAVGALRAIVEAGYSVVAVYSQPPRPAGRGHHVTRSPVHEYADSVGIPVYTPKSLRNAEAQAIFQAHGADLAIVAAYGLILPKEILEAPKRGCINIHASLLPRWRGAAPIQRAIMAGDSQTGITIMQMDEGLDTGDMLRMEAIPITAETTATTLHDKLAELGSHLIVETIPQLLEGTLIPVAQPEEGVTYAAKLSKSESQIDWHRSAIEIQRKISALCPWPGVYFIHNDTVLKVAAAEVVSSHPAQPGLVMESLTIACGENALKVTSVQKAGGRWLSADEFLRGYDLPLGTILPCPAIN
ncbi:methionyl-tRNA formyltransferase [Candidatus Odyssella acanthamoebae]|uniref:Methionyl-tRNA formyltransferase n=1 Tax=Candidatus Odyssella acanthamoebae TaxID=91604 RepID=A0A077AYL6_9PROT|nr:methionyl-tRNA formyltransferase [Candidatus Paracaedibacter acanthamoebae]AIK97089.1 methionyl-tRNA formyltransferase [Candidatus Paracaedibacter acanthamoebae]